MSTELIIASKSNRIQWMDVARGLAILLVIMFHAVEESDKQFGLPMWVTTINEIISPARLPLMVFLSGFLLPRSLAKPPMTYVRGKISRIAWPFLLWSCIMLILTTVANPHYLPDIWQRSAVALTSSPIDHLWFLRDLFLFYVIALLLRRVPAVVTVSAALLVAIAATALEMPDLLRGAYLMVFFILGAWTGSLPDALNRLLDSRKILFAAIFLALAIVPAALQPGDVRYQLVLLPVAAALAYLMLRLCRFVSGFSAARSLANIGRNSLVYYLAHWPVIVILSNFAPPVLADNPVVMLPLLLFVALMASYFLVELAKRLSPFRYLTSIPPLERVPQAA